MAGLKNAARRYVRSSFAVLVDRCIEYDPRRGGMPRWEPTENAELFVLREPELTALEACLQDELPRIEDTNDRAVLIAALAADRRTGPYIGVLVGTPMMAARVEADALATQLVWEVARETGSFVFSEEAFSRSYAAWLARITRTVDEVTVLAPLHPLDFDGSIALEEGLEIAQLSDAEVSTCLYVGAIHTPFAAAGGMAQVPRRVAIRVAVPEPRGLHNQFTDADQQQVSDAESRALGLAHEVVTALRVYKKGRVALRGQVLVDPSGSMRFGRLQSTVAGGHALSLTDADERPLQHFWHMFKRARERNAALSATVRRFSYAGERVRPDDEIVDLVAAMEALLLAGIDDRRELSYRTALRGAAIIEAPDGLTKREVQRQLRQAYGVRSAVAHGGAPDARNLRASTGATLTLDEFVASIEELVRLLIVKVVAGVADGAPWPPDWDALILEGATYP